MKVIFVDRDSVQSRRDTRATIKERLSEGLSVLIFPEGTTHIGPDVLPFKPGMFNTCAEGGFSIIPTAIEYQNRNMAWIGTDTFLPHFFRAFSHRAVCVSVSFGSPVSGSDPQALRTETQSWVENETMRLRNLWDKK
jgi:1-acyl-sn-glycerol-3-phosphate acyltransferase